MLKPLLWTIERFGEPKFGSGPRGIRTLDLLNAIEARSQLRHGPIFSCHRPGLVLPSGPVDLVGREPNHILYFCRNYPLLLADT